MNNSEVKIWGIHGGKTGDADSLFLSKNCVALGWEKMGDLSKLGADRESFRKQVSTIYPDKTTISIANNTGQLYRFVHELKIGDLVVYPSRIDHQVHIGKVEGDYKYQPKGDNNYPHARQVKWLKTLPRTIFSQGALYEVGSAMSFFQVKNYAEEYEGALQGKPAIPTPVIKDETVSIVANDIEETTQDFILKRLSQELKGTPLEEFVAHLLEAMGYRTRLTRQNEPSIDIIAHKDALGFEAPIIKVQVKSSDGKVSDKDVSALIGKLGQNEFGLVVALGGFTPPALTFAANKPNLRLIDGNELVELIYEYYEQFDSRYKGLLPLKRVYVPAPIQEEE